MLLGAAFYGATSTYADAPDVDFSTFTGTSPFSSTGYSKYYHNKDLFDDSVILNGVDISAYQSGDKSNYATAKSKGVDFAIVRTTFTYVASGKMAVDSEWTTHYDKAREAGLMTGLYCFSQAITEKEAKAEANLICDTFEEHIQDKYGSTNYKAYLDMPIYMDDETGSGYRNSKVSKSKATKCVEAFCETIKSRGYTPGLYASTSFLKNKIDGASLGSKYELWVAQYWAANAYVDSDYNKWQYSSSAKIAGLLNFDGKKCNIDVNYWYLDLNRSGTGSNDVAKCTVKGQAECLYTGSVVHPNLTFSMDGTKLKEGTDYTIGYAKNIKKGTGYAYVRGIGNYSGYKLVPFTIGDTVTPADDDDDDDSENVDGYVHLTDAAEDAGYSLLDGELSGPTMGTTVSTVKKRVKINDEYSGYSLKILDRRNDKALSTSKLVSTGDLLAIYDADSKKIGTISLKVTVPKVTLSSVSAKKKKITVKWKTLSESKATGYQVQYCMYKDMPSEYVGTKKITSYKTKSTSVTANYAAKYYARVRAYKTLRGKTFYSKWSATKSCTTK